MFIIKIRFVLEAPQIRPLESLFPASHTLSSMPAPVCTCPCQPLVPPYVCNLYLSHHPSCHFKIKPHFLFNSKLSWPKSLPNEVCYEICLFPDLPSQGPQGSTAQPHQSAPLAFPCCHPPGAQTPCQGCMLPPWTRVSPQVLR